MKLIKEESIPIRDRFQFGLCRYHYRISKLRLWCSWIMQCIFNGDHDMSWSESKKLATEGKLHVLVYGGACLGPLWTNVYHIK